MKTNRISILVSLCVALGCGSETTTAPEAVATKIVAASPVFVTGTVASAVIDRPSVIVLDQNGNPMRGASVSFAQTFGVGTVSGTDVVTDASGRATLGEWILGKKVGQNIITARVASLNISFFGTATAGPAASLSKASGDDQFALPGATLMTPQTVVVRDTYDNPVVGKLVRFAVSSGGGMLAAASATSDAMGVASVSGWKLGPSGVQSLTAEADGVAPVTFNATIAEDPCGSLSLAAGATSPSMDVNEFGCTLADGRRANFYRILVTSASVYEFKTQSSAFNNLATLATLDGTPVAQGSATPSTSSHFRAFLKQGTYVLRVASAGPAERGTYVISFNFANPQTGCEETFLSIDSQIPQTLERGDCQPAGGQYEDRYLVFVEAGGRVKVTMASAEVDNVIRVIDPDNTFITSTDVTWIDGDLYGAHLAFTAEKTGYYLVVASTVYFPGSYTLFVQRAP